MCCTPTTTISVYMHSDSGSGRRRDVGGGFSALRQIGCGVIMRLCHSLRLSTLQVKELLWSKTWTKALHRQIVPTFIDCQWGVGGCCCCYIRIFEGFCHYPHSPYSCTCVLDIWEFLQGEMLLPDRARELCVLPVHLLQLLVFLLQVLLSAAHLVPEGGPHSLQLLLQTGHLWTKISVSMSLTTTIKEGSACYLKTTERSIWSFEISVIGPPWLPCLRCSLKGELCAPLVVKNNECSYNVLNREWNHKLALLLPSSRHAHLTHWLVLNFNICMLRRIILVLLFLFSKLV